MKLNLLLLIVLIILTNCGKNRDAEVEELTSIFEEKSGIKNFCSIIFDETLPNNTAGKSTRNTTNCKIKLNPKIWNYYTILQKEGLIFHELGHGILNRGHELEGYMHWQIHSDKVYKENRENWIRTFFLHN